MGACVVVVVVAAVVVLGARWAAVGCRARRSVLRPSGGGGGSGSGKRGAGEQGEKKERKIL
jgi:hypothetical protein